MSDDGGVASKKPWYRRWWGMALIGLFIIAGIGAIIDPPPTPAPKAVEAREPEPSTFDRLDAESDRFRLDRAQMQTWRMIADPSLPADAFLAQARERCAGMRFCDVWAWTDRAAAATALPPLEREIAAAAFHYALNRSTGFERAHWNCRRYRRADRAECMQ